MRMLASAHLHRPIITRNGQIFSPNTDEIRAMPVISTKKRDFLRSYLTHSDPPPKLTLGRVGNLRSRLASRGGRRRAKLPSPHRDAFSGDMDGAGVKRYGSISTSTEQIR
jgi:hypothetical protein